MWLLMMTPIQAFKELREETERVKWSSLADMSANVSMATQTMKNEGGSIVGVDGGAATAVFQVGRDVFF